MALRQTGYVGWVERGYVELGKKRLEKSFVDQVLSKEKECSVPVVLSCESTLGTMREAYAGAVEKMQHMKACFDGVDLKLVVYVREQVGWLESVYTQCLHEGDVLEIDEFLDRVLLSPFVKM